MKRSIEFYWINRVDWASILNWEKVWKDNLANWKNQFERDQRWKIIHIMWFFYQDIVQKDGYYNNVS